MNSKAVSNCIAANVIVRCTLRVIKDTHSLPEVPK